MLYDNLPPMKYSLHPVKGKMVTLTKGIHQALRNFCWLVQDMERHPTPLTKLVLPQPTLDRYHATSRYMCGGGSPPGTHCSTLDTASADQSFVSCTWTHRGALP